MVPTGGEIEVWFRTLRTGIGEEDAIEELGGELGDGEYFVNGYQLCM